MARRMGRWVGTVGTLLVTLLGCGDPPEPLSTDSTWAALMDDGDSSAIAPTAAGATSTAAPRYCTDCTREPLAYWTLDDCNAQSTELADSAYSSGISHPAFRAVSTACVVGIEGQAIELAQKEDILYAPDQPDFVFDQGLTVAAWIKPSSVKGAQSIVRKRLDGTSSFTLAIQGGRLHFVVRLTSGKLVGVTAPVEAGRYTHVAGTYDGQQLILYLDGAVAAQASAAGTITPGVGPIFIGNDALGRRLQGVVDNVWLNTFAAPADTVRGLNCTRKPPVVSLSPSETPPEPAGTNVPFDLSVTNPSDPTFCPSDTFYYYLWSLPYPLNTNDYFGEMTVAPGASAHATVNVSSIDAGLSGPFDFEVFVGNEANNSLQATALATYVLAPPEPPSRTGCAATPTAPVAPGGYYVNGNTICTGDGRAHLLRGVDRPSLEWMSPGQNLSLADFELMATWNANVVRIALNQDFWLSGSPLADPYYPATVDTAIAWAEMAGMDVILDLHWSDTGVLGSCDPSGGCQQMMPDTNSLTFWTEVASRYAGDGRVMFELYNEPHDVSWDVWRNGGDTGYGWQAVGMQTLYDAVRSTGAQNLVLIGGLDWAYDLSGVPSYRIDGYNIVYASHPYGPYRDPRDWGRAWGTLTRTDPVIVTEFGMLNDTACTTDYAAQVIAYADAHFASWTAWAWYPGGCTFPAIVTDWAGTPSALGAVVKAALLSVTDPPASPPRPSTGGPDVNYTFDHEPQGWTLNDYADPNYTNLGATVPPGATAPTLSFESADGDPNPGSLRLTVGFSALDQYVSPIINLAQPGLNLTGKTLHAEVRLVSGSLGVGGLQLYALSGSSYTYTGGAFVGADAVPLGTWVPLTLDLTSGTAVGFDPAQVVQIGIQVFSGFSSGGATFENNGPMVLAIDTVTD